MGRKRPQNRRTGNKKGDNDMKGQRRISEFTVKNTRDAIQKPTAKKTSVSGRPIPSRPSSRGRHVADDGGQAMHDQMNELMRQRLARVNKPRDKAGQDDFDESKLQNYWAAIPEGDSDVLFQGLLQQHINFASTGGQQAGAREVLGRWKDVLDDNFQGDEALRDRLCRFITTTAQSHHHDDEDDGEPAQRIDPLKGAKAKFPSQGTSKQGGSATKKPLYLLNKVIEYPDDLVEERRRQGRIKLWGNVAEHVDYLYPGIKGERYDELCKVDPLYEDLDIDATPQNFVASIHNLYLDLRDCKWLNRDDLLSGLRLALLGRDDVFLSPIDLGFGEGEDSPFGGIEDFDWKQRRFHVVLFFHNRNHFAVIIGDRKQGQAIYYNMIPFTEELFANVKTRYARFLAAIGGPNVALSRGKGPEQTDSNSCGLLVLEAVRHVFREHAGDIAGAGQNAFSVARSMTDLLGEGPVSPDEESYVVVAKLRRTWLLCLEKELGGDGERRVALWELPAGGSLPDAASHTAEEFMEERYPKGIHVLWNKIDHKRGRHLRLVVGAVNSTIEQTEFVADVPKPTVEEIRRLLQTDDPTADDVLAAIEKFWAAKGANARIMINSSDGTMRPFNNNGVGNNHFVLLHADRGLFFGMRRAITKPRKNREEKTYPYADDKYDEKFGGELGGADKGERVDRILEHFGDQFADVAGDDTDRPQKYGPDYLSGWPTHFLPSPMNPDLDAVLPFAMAHGALRYYSVANTAVTSSFLNLAKGGTRLPADIAIIAELLRVLKDEMISLPERKSRTDWLTTALDNMAVIRSYGGFAEKGHINRHAYWEGLSGQERQDILKAFCTGEVTGFLRQKLDEALNKEGLLKMRTGKLKAKVSNHDRERIRDECRLISESYGLSSDEFKELLLLDGTPCPFHVTSHAALRRLGYNLDNLSVWIRSSDFYDRCNKNADSHGLHERDAKLHWERLLYDIWHTVSKRARAAIDRVALLRPSLHRSDEDFMEEVKYFILDREGLPPSPWVHHPLQLVIATKGPPNTAMFTGFARRKDGLLPTEGPVLHAEPFDPVGSFDEGIQNTSPDTGWTNKIMGFYDPSFWPYLFAILSQIPFEGPYRKIGEGVGRIRLDQPGEPPSRATAPDPSYHDVKVPAPPYDELLGGGDEHVVFACSGCPGREFTAGAFQEHLNKEHSVWAVKCSGCGLRFSDEAAEAAHHEMNACLGKEGGLDEAATAASSYLCCPHGNCKRGPDSGQPFSRQHELQKHLENIHTSAEDKELPTIACECGYYFCTKLSQLSPHLLSDTHEKHMKADREVEEEDSRYYCPECDQALQTQGQWDNHQASSTHKMTSRCQSQEAGAFRRVTAAEANAPKAEKAEKAKTGNCVMTRKAAEAQVARRGDEWKGKKHKCKSCRVGFDDKYHLTRHEATDSHLLIIDSDYIAGSKDPSSKVYYCPACHYGTDRKNHWNRHISCKPHKDKVARSSTIANNNTNTGSPDFINGKAKELPSRVRDAILNTKGCEETRRILALIDPDPRQAHLKIYQASQAKRVSTDSNVEPIMSEQKRRKSLDGVKIPVTTGDGEGEGKDDGEGEVEGDEDN
ncbi:hypothetical protein LA080_000962 [Diaporthe eres]|nr:hypothetical protein LA080_000962 [Diaporthe eres]